MLSHFNRVQLIAIPWTVALEAPLFMEFSRQEYWNGLPFPSPGDIPNPEIEPKKEIEPALAGRFFATAPPGKPLSTLGRLSKSQVFLVCKRKVMTPKVQGCCRD